MTGSAQQAVETATEQDRSLIEPLNKVLDSLRPVFRSEGLNARLHSIKNGVAHVVFGGGCEGCNGALAGMEGGLRLMLIERVPGLKEVIFE